MTSDKIKTLIDKYKEFPMKCSHSGVSVLLFFAVLLTLIFQSCTDNTLDPIEDDRGIYSFYGFIEVGESPNYVRIRNSDEPFLADAENFDGTVTFENMNTGEVSTLRDTIITFGQNNTHNFIIEDEIEPDTPYLLKAERSDGLQSQATANAPKTTELELFPSENIFCETDINFVFGNVRHSERIDMNISATNNGQVHESQLSVFIDEYQYTEGEDEVRIRLSPRNLLVEVFTPVLPDNPYFDPYLLIPTVGCSQIDSGEIHVTYTHYGSEWTEGRPLRGPVDTESGQVENGLGFFGAINRDTVTINIQE